jgi:hypothetical protein
MTREQATQKDPLPKPERYKPIDWVGRRIDAVRSLCNLAETWRICDEPRCRRHQSCLADLPCTPILAMPRLTPEEESASLTDFFLFMRERFGDPYERDDDDSEDTTSVTQSTSRPRRRKNPIKTHEDHRFVKVVIARLWWPPRSPAEREEALKFLAARGASEDHSSNELP